MTVGFLIPIRGDAEASSVHVALSSIGHQTRPADQIVIVVDGPASAELDGELAHWRAIWSERLTVVSLSTRHGVAGALNEGLARVTTEWVARMDADDYSDAERLAMQMAYVAAHPDVDVVGSWLLDYGEDHQHPDRVKTCPKEHDEIASMMWFRNPLNHPSVMFRRSAVEAVGGYDAAYGDDDHLWAKLWVAGRRFHNIPLCLVRRHRDQRIFERRGVRWLRSDLRVRGYLRQAGKIGWLRFLMSCGVMLSLRISPVWMKRLAYVALTRPVSPNQTQAGARSEDASAAGRTVWIFHHYGDPPDGHWTGTYDVYKHLAARGHRVTVFNSSFSHYSRRDDRLASGQMMREQFYGGMRFIFVRTTPYERNDWRRVLNMLTYAWRSARIAVDQTERPDVVIGSTPHPFAVGVAGWVAKRNDCPFILELHDLWLQYLLDTGALRSWNPLAKGLELIDRWCYRRAAKIMMLWPRMDLYLRGFDVPPERLAWVPMGVVFDAAPMEASSRNAGDGVLRVAWTGRIGPASNALEILQAAKILHDRGRHDITFTLIGGGPDEQALRQFKETERLDNVVFTGMLPKRELPPYLRDADVCVAGLPPVETYAHYGTIPSKLLDYMAEGKPVVFITTIPDNALSRAEAGVVVPPNAPDELAAAFERLAGASAEERRRLGENGRQYVRVFHNPEKLAARIGEIIEEILI